MREWLRLIRYKYDMTQAEVADLVGIAESHYSMIETGSRRPSVDKAQLIAEVLNFDWRLFFPNKNSDPKQVDTA